MNPNLPPQYYRRFFEEAPVGLALCQMSDGSFVTVNQAFADILGWTVEETMRLGYWNVTPRKYEAMEQEQLQLLRTKGEYGPYEKEYIHRNGSLVPVRLRGRRVTIDEVDYIWSMVEDLSGEKYRILLKKAMVGLVLSDRDGRLIDVNDQFVKLVGWTEDDLKGMSFSNLTPAEFLEQETEYFNKVNSTGRAGPYSKQFINKDGSGVPVMLTGMKIELDGTYYIWSFVEHGVFGGRVSEPNGGQPVRSTAPPLVPINPLPVRIEAQDRPIRPREEPGRE